MPWEEAPQEPSPPDPGVRGFGVCRAGPRMHHAHWTVNAAEVAVGSSPLLVTVSPGQTCTLCRSSPAVRELLAGEEGPSAAVSAGVWGVWAAAAPLSAADSSLGPDRREPAGLVSDAFTRCAQPQRVALQVTQQIDGSGAPECGVRCLHNPKKLTKRCIPRVACRAGRKDTSPKCPGPRKPPPEQPPHFRGVASQASAYAA